METTRINFKTIVFFLVLILLTFFLFKRSGEKSDLQVKNDKYLKSNDSLNILYQKSILRLETHERHLKELNTKLLVAKNNSQASETKYYALKNKIVKPKYIESVVNCNDTIQSMYKYAVTKDSLCNVVIIDKNQVIKTQDTIIKTNALEKKEYIVLLDLKENANKNLNSIILNNNKEIKKEKLKKNFWKLIAIGASGLLLKKIITK